MRSFLLVLFGAGLLCAAGPGEFRSLMPKKDIGEHWIAEIAPASIWHIRDGMIYCEGKPNGFLRSKEQYADFVLRAEWRFEAEGWTRAPERWPNAGFFIHALDIVDGWPTSQEVQGHFGQAGSLFGVRGGKITGAKRGPIVKDRPQFGEWDKYEITSKGGKVTVTLNDKLVNEGTDAYPAKGSVCLQSEGWPVWYRNVEIKELQ
jgi:hypothetical protein